MRVPPSFTWHEKAFFLFGLMAATMFFVWADMVKPPQKSLAPPADAFFGDFKLSNAGDVHVWGPQGAMVGEIVFNNITATKVGLFNSPGVVFTATGFPLVVTWKFSQHCVPTCTTILTIDATKAAGTAGTFPITVSGNNGSLTRTTTFNLIFNDYTFSCLPSNISITIPLTGQPKPANVTCNLSVISGDIPELSFEFHGLPPGITATANPVVCTPSCTTTITFTATRQASTGMYVIDPVSGAGDEYSWRVSSPIFLTVNEELPPPGGGQEELPPPAADGPLPSP